MNVKVTYDSSSSSVDVNVFPANHTEFVYPLPTVAGATWNVSGAEHSQVAPIRLLGVREPDLWHKNEDDKDIHNEMLAAASSAFSFWLNEEDACYDNL